MNILEPLRSLPEPLKKILRPMGSLLVRKSSAEISYWRSKFKIDGGMFSNAHYEEMMLAMAQEADDRFLQKKIVADFGCGPRGSLVWAASASLRIGIDVLADQYADEFSKSILTHSMIYLKSTEKVIPLPSGFVDVLFTLNAMDHVDEFPVMCSEIIRILKHGGVFIGSFNLEEPKTAAEPQRLNQEIIDEHLLSHLDVQTYRVANRGPKENPYASFYTGELDYDQGKIGFLWVKALKR